MNKADLIRKKCAQESYIHSYANKMVPRSQRQIPLYSQVGKGLRGDFCTLELQEGGSNPKIMCMYHDQLYDGSGSPRPPYWQLPLVNLVPKLHYEVWEGVREIDGTLYNVYWIRFTCDVTIVEQTYTFWTFDTPYTTTSPFVGGGNTRRPYYRLG